MEGHDDATETVISGLRSTGMRSIPARLAFAFLTYGRVSWFLAVVCVPLVLLAAGLWIHPVFASSVVGFSLCLLTVLWKSSRERVGARATIDSRQRTVRLERSNASGIGWPKTRELDDDTDAAVVTLGDSAVVRFDGSAFSSVPGFVVSRSDLPATVEVLRASGVGVSRTDRTLGARRRVSGPAVRILLSLAVLLGVPIYGAVRLGPMILIGSGPAIFGWIFVAWLVGQSLTSALGLRPERRRYRLLLDCVVVVVLLLVTLVAGLAVWLVLS